jgi:arylsulfatase A-like enzyme
MSETKSTATRPALLTGLGLSLLLSIALMAISYARIAGDSQSMLFRTSVLDSLMAGQIWGTLLAWNLTLFGAAMICAHLLFGLAAWAVARFSMVAYGTAKATHSQHVWLWFLALSGALLCFNASHFPFSSLGESYAVPMSTSIGALTLGSWIALGIAAAASVTTLLGGWRLWRDGARGVRHRMAMTGVVIVAAMLWVTIPRTPPVLPLTDKPNVILIGLDSLRRDLVDPATSPKVTPTLAKFLENGTWFEDATTPLARTFPSMTSLLTGRQPHKTGAYMNLLPREMIREGDTLGRILGRQGYRSIYATDEVRFSNIDATFGFDQTITPPIGSSEFLIALMADTPVSNAVMNTALGKLLFPHVHANRGAAKVYDPDRFVARIADEAQFRAPLFLATHLTLSHWPYFWSDAPPRKREPDARWPEYYLNVARRADAQLGALLAVLEQRGALRNAIVVLYSDHGEAFGIPQESLTPEHDPLIDSLHARPTWGHGVSVLSPHQYRVVLSMRGFGAMEGRIPSGLTVSEPVTLMDVAPTLVKLTGSTTDSPFDGRPLLGLMAREPGAIGDFAHRVRFTETEYAPSDLTNKDGKLSASAIVAASQVYSVDPRTDRVEVKRDRTAELLHNRQYAAMGDKLLLAALPSKMDGLSHHFVVVDRQGGEPRRLTHVPGPADAPELQRLWHALYGEFGNVLPPEGTFGDVASSTVASNDH